MTSPNPDADPGDAAPLSASLRRLAARGVRKRFGKGVQFIVEGEHGDTFFIILSGRVQAFSENDDGSRAIVFNEYGPGEHVGEMSLDGGPRAASVRTTEITHCAMVTLDTLRQHMADEPEFAAALVLKLIRRLRAATASARQQSLEDVYGRLKETLERNAQREPASATRLWQNAPSQSALARFLGCGREMINKVMKELQAGGYIDYGPGWVRLLKRLPQGR